MVLVSVGRLRFGSEEETGDSMRHQTTIVKRRLGEVRTENLGRRDSSGDSMRHQTTDVKRRLGEVWTDVKGAR